MKKAILCSLSLALASFSLFAYDFTDSGFTLAPDSKTDGSAYTLIDASGGNVNLMSEVDLSADRVAALKSLVAEVRSWKNVTIASVNADNRADSLQLSVLPSAITLANADLGSALPDGIRLYAVAGATEYDFKLLSGHYVIRLRGPYTGESDLESQISLAYGNPEGFLEANDPAFLSKKVSDLETRLGYARSALLSILSGGHAPNQQAVDKLDDLKRATPALNKADAAKQLKAAGFSLSAAEISAVFLVDFGEGDAAKH